jgi:hypothetical protein
MTGLDQLRAQGRMTWIATERGWAAALEDVVLALTDDGFVECKRAMTTSRRDRQPAGGLWEGVDARTGSVASLIWESHEASPRPIIFLTVDGASIEEDRYSEDGGEG